MNNRMTVVLGLTLFALVMTGIYLAIFLDNLIPNFEESADIIMPFIVFTGFFIFLIAAFLIALTIMKTVEENNKKKQKLRTEDERN